MSNTKKHKNKGKFNNGLLEELPRDLEKMFDRWNWDVGEFRKAKKDLEEKIAEKELKRQIELDEYNFKQSVEYIEDEDNS